MWKSSNYRTPSLMVWYKSCFSAWACARTAAIQSVNARMVYVEGTQSIYVQVWSPYTNVWCCFWVLVCVCRVWDPTFKMSKPLSFSTHGAHCGSSACCSNKGAGGEVASKRWAWSEKSRGGQTNVSRTRGGHRLELKYIKIFGGGGRTAPSNILKTYNDYCWREGSHSDSQCHAEGYP